MFILIEKHIAYLIILTRLDILLVKELHTNTYYFKTERNLRRQQLSSVTIKSDRAEGKKVTSKTLKVKGNLTFSTTDINITQFLFSIVQRH